MLFRWIFRHEIRAPPDRMEQLRKRLDAASLAILEGNVKVGKGFRGWKSISFGIVIPILSFLLERLAYEIDGTESGIQ